MFLEVLICLAILIILLLMLWNIFQYSDWCDAQQIPGPPGYILFGNLLDLGGTIEDYFRNMYEMSRKYGNYIKLWYGYNQLLVILSDPDGIEELLTSNVHLDKGSGYDNFKLWLGNGIINCKTELWRKPRKILTPTFHFKILEKFFHVFNSCGDIFIDILGKKGAKGPVNIWPMFKSYALDVICETSMGKQINAQLDENNKYVKAVDDFMEFHMRKYFSPYRNYKWLYCFTEDYKKEQEVIKTLKDLTKEVINSRKRTIIKEERLINDDNFGIKNRLALLDFLFAYKDKDGLSDTELNDHVNTFLMAGHHTISSALSFCLFQAAKYPEMQAKLVDEIHSIIGKNNAVPITMQHVQQLKYLECFIKETLRLYTTVPFFERKLRDNFKIGQYLLPKGTTIQIFAYALHHDEKYFPDPENFDPDRFLPQNCAQRHPFAYIPFSAGPRNCIGFRFAMLQLKTTIANVLRKLELSAVVPEHEIILANDAVLRALNGILINAKFRT